MRALVAEFLSFLRQRPLAWLLPLLGFWVLLACLAWREAQVPHLPFTYRVF